jgi:cobyrinic acid a,c-diamide synthase
LPKQAKSLPERHLGLVLPGEVQDIDQLLDQLADQLAFDQAAWDSLRPVQIEPAPTPHKEPLLAGMTIAVARDPAFMFLYPANLETLRAMGATLKFFSPLADEAVPVEADAVYLPAAIPSCTRNSCRRRASGTPPSAPPMQRHAHRRRMRWHDGAGRYAGRPGGQGVEYGWLAAR